MNEQTIILRYHEIALKGANRAWFEERLAANARKLMQRAFSRELGHKIPLEINRLHGRIVLTGEWNTNEAPVVRHAFEHLFGLSSYSPAWSVPTDLQALTAAALERFSEYLKTHPFPKTFRVLTKRCDKALPQTSMEIDRIIGGTLHDAYPELQVQLENPEFTLGVDIRTGHSHIWTEKIQGPGGLPVGTSGHVLSLLSGGIDSPVAAISVLKRGVTTGFIHFYGTPFVGIESLEKVKDLAKAVNRFQPDPQPLHVIPFGKIQEKIALRTNPKLRTILYRRMMIRIASAVAESIHARALVTGESIGQVASQTLDNINAIQAASSQTILRPLIAMDKQDIIKAAQHWDTFETAIRPGIDSCTLFADKHPSIGSTVAVIEEQESRFSVTDLKNEALAALELHRPASG